MLISSLRRHPADLAWLAVWSLLQAMPSVASGWVIAQAVSWFLAGRPAAGTGWLALLALAALAGGFGARQATLRLGALVEPLRDELVAFIVEGALARSVGDTTRPPDTDAVARMTHQAEIVRDSCAGVLTVASTFLITAGSTLAGLVTLVPATLPYAVPPVCASVLILRLLLRPFAARQRRSVIGEEALAGRAAQAVSGLRDVTACGAENQVLELLGTTIRRQADAARALARIGSARVACLTVGGWLPMLLVLAAAPSMLRSGVSPARLIGAIAYISGSLRGALSVVSQGVTAGLVRLTVTLDRILEAGAPPVAPPPGRSPVPLRPACPGLPSPAGDGTAGSLRLRGVWFGYDVRAQPVISDLSLDIEPGSHLAIVGPSGIGKSTLAWLLAGLLRPTVGDILLDGVPLTQYPPESLPLRRVLIPQEAYVFTGTLAENLRYLRPPGDTPPGEPPPAEPDTAELDAAADAVGLSPLASRLGGYRAVVNPAALSAGERQLVALTRAYLSAAPIVILDEAASHLDPAAEARAEAAFAGRPGTLIVIAHRISSALRARNILVLDGSRARIGDHASLVTSSASYRDMVGYWSAATATGGPQSSSRARRAPAGAETIA